jgi:hypothetical protein
MEINVTRKAVYLDRELTDEEKQSSEVHHVRGPRPGPDLTDGDIESRAHRIHIPADQGEVCITIEPSTEHLGQLYVNIQFEGRYEKPTGADDDRRRHDSCQHGQNRVLVSSSRWLEELLAQISAAGVRWDVALDARPCPGATVPVALEAAVAALHGVAVDTAVAHGTTVENLNQIEGR